MCYFTNDFLNEISLREELQQKAIKNEYNLDFYCQLKQLNLKQKHQQYIDAEGAIRNILASFLILLNSDAFLSVRLSKSKFYYLLNEFSFELTVCENICNAIKNSNSKYIFVNTKFNNKGFKVIVYYNGKAFNPYNYCFNSFVKSQTIGLINRVVISFNTAKKPKQKPPKINLDGYIKNKLSSVFIALYLSGLKRFN